jgi:hypothetical protein
LYVHLIRAIELRKVFIQHLENIMLGLPDLPIPGFGGGDDKNDGGGNPLDMLSGGIPGADLLGGGIPGADLLSGGIPFLDMFSGGDPKSEGASDKGSFDVSNLLNIAGDVGLF